VRPARDSTKDVLQERGHPRRLGQRGELGYRVVNGCESAGKSALHYSERQRGGAQPYRFVQMLEDERVFSGFVATPRSAVADVVADHPLQLEGYVLDDVREIRSALETNDESAGLADAAAVIVQSGHRGDERGGDPADIRRRDVLVRTNGEIHARDRQPRPVIGSTRGVERRHPDFRERIGAAIATSHYFTPSAEYWRITFRLAVTSSARITTRSFSCIFAIALAIASFSL
jgi:hypothetical protein